jgi:hypothetical protein
MSDRVSRHSRRAVVVMIVLILVGSVSMTYYMHRSSRRLVESLDSQNLDTVCYSLTLLKQRRDPEGIAKAIDLLNSSSKDVQTEAALYLGAMGKSQSIPYLINALNGAEDQDAREISVDLTMLTGEDFGTKYNDWNAWWMARHPKGAATQGQ